MTGSGLRTVVLFLLPGIRFGCRVKWVLFIGNSRGHCLGFVISHDQPDQGLSHKLY